MFDFKQTEEFQKWWKRLADEQAKGLIASRLNRLAYGQTGDVAPVGSGVSELRVHHGPGYRVYFRKREGSLIILLCGGDKSSQARDIKLAKRLSKVWGE